MTATINASTSAGVVTTADTSGILQLQTNGTAALTVDASQNTTIAGTLTTTGVTTFAAGTAALPAITTTGDTNTGIFFPAADQVAITTGGTQRAVVDASGNVGIGTSSPTQKLELNSGFVKVGTGVGGGGGVWFPYSSDAAGRTWRARTDIVGYGDFGFEQSTTQTGTTFATKMLIDSSGNLLVNQTALNGAGKVEISYDRASQWGMQIRNTTGTTAATTFIEFKYVSSTVGYIGSSNGTSTQYNTSSDYRLKEDIAPITGALAKVVALKPVTYKWKSTGMVDEGFIAHELAEVCPSAVTGTKDAVETYTDEDGNEATRPVYQGIDTSFLVATLTAAIQELKAIVDTQGAEIAKLKGA